MLLHRWNLVTVSLRTTRLCSNTIFFFNVLNLIIMATQRLTPFTMEGRQPKCTTMTTLSGNNQFITTMSRVKTAMEMYTIGPFGDLYGLLYNTVGACGLIQWYDLPISMACVGRATGKCPSWMCPVHVNTTSVTHTHNYTI